MRGRALPFALALGAPEAAFAPGNAQSLSRPEFAILIQTSIILPQFPCLFFSRIFAFSRCFFKFHFSGPLIFFLPLRPQAVQGSFIDKSYNGHNWNQVLAEEQAKTLTNRHRAFSWCPLGWGEGVPISGGQTVGRPERVSGGLGERVRLKKAAAWHPMLLLVRTTQGGGWVLASPSPVGRLEQVADGTGGSGAGNQTNQPDCRPPMQLLVRTPRRGGGWGCVCVLVEKGPGREETYAEIRSSLDLLGDPFTRPDPPHGPEGWSRGGGGQREAIVPAACRGDLPAGPFR